MGDTTAIEDIAEKLETDQDLYRKGEAKTGGQIFPDYSNEFLPDENG